ncbi:arabinosyltransferase domain-containing protein [Pseudonocardia hispaniensis]|uniref:Arabinosyltransferase domain-containing protein n=1 Tax=Pseudonocardia hispaniensis TaxID=904933 RepID=A0ABW1J786_9PSEU
MLSGVPASESIDRNGSAESSTPAPTAGPRLWVLVLGLISALAALAFPFAPVTQPVVGYSWTPADGRATAIGLMPYQPVSLSASVSCAAIRAAPPGTLLLATVPPHTDPAAERLAGLDLRVVSTGLQVRTAGVPLGVAPVPADACTFTLTSNDERTQLLRDGVPVLARDGDLRPAVAGAFTDVDDPAAVALQLTADTRFQTTITPLKAVLAGLCVLGLIGMLVALARCDRAVRPRVRLFGRGWRPRPVDLAVTALLGLWWVIGPITVDDGYIAGIVRNRDSSGFIGNVYRWLNAPEAPFSWFYELYHWWAQVSPSTLWMRLPSTLLGLACWAVLSRAVLPRLGRFAVRSAAVWLAAAAFAVWWLPFNLGLRPEPWVALGSLAVFVALERAVATRAVLPLVVGLLLAGATTALTPGGLMAFAPVLAAGLPLLRLLRVRRDLHRLPLLVALVAAPAAAVLLMFADQSLAAVLEAVRVRGVIGGGVPWYQEYQRYQLLLEPDEFQGAIGRRAPVLLTLLAAAGVVWSVTGRGRAGIAAGPARRLVVAFGLALVTMTATPTKWTQHFGDVAGLGAAVLLLGFVAWSAPGLRVRARTATPVLVGLALLTVVGALVLAGTNSWPYVSGWYEITWSTMPPQLAGVLLAVVWLAAGVVLLVALLARSAWAGSAAGSGPAARRVAAAVPLPRRLPAPATVALVLLLAVVALQVLGFAKTSLAHRDGYTLASDAAATLGGQPCGLERDLSVETDPAAGALPTVGAPAPVLPVVAADVGGPVLPGVAVAGTGATPWFGLDDSQRTGNLPVVVTVSGSMRPGDRLNAEFAARPDGTILADEPVTTPTRTSSADVRLMAPRGATAVRLVVDAPSAPGARADPPAVVSLPRVPRLTPMIELLPPGTPAILDWPVAFVFPCLRPEPLSSGTAGLATWRVGPPAEDPAAKITYSPEYGGPFATSRLLVTEQRMATYLRDDPTRDAAQLYRWVPVQSLTTLTPTMTDRTIAGWHAEGRTRIPGLDPVGM